MFDTVKEHLTPKTFGIVAYICSFIRFLCGLAFTGAPFEVAAMFFLIFYKQSRCLYLFMSMDVKFFFVE